MLIIAGLLLAFVLLLIFGKRRGRLCRWRRRGPGPEAGQSLYICMYCGAEAFTSDGNPPLICPREDPAQKG
ncbi:hypothetical protein ACM25N_09915 [Roseovarius sp. C7]|uniref:hypothetical protein n=1 Tax=Roseovarius sp. C7 TaxID=3398643 RepID=UPI0039F7386B